jgi:hypothetical protein
MINVSVNAIGRFLCAPVPQLHQSAFKLHHKNQPDAAAYSRGSPLFPLNYMKTRRRSIIAKKSIVYMSVSFL